MLPKILEEIRVLLDGKVVECPNSLNGEHANLFEKQCELCHGTGKRPDPDYDPLREVVREKCPGNPGSPGRACKGNDEDGEYEHTLCDGTGRIPRSFWGWPKGALEGSIRRNLPLGWYLTGWYRAVAGLPSLKAEVCTPRGNYYSAPCDDPDLAAAEALLEALKGQA